MFDGIIFDLDGTLWDSRRDVCDVWNLAFERLPQIDLTVTVEEFTACMGMILSDIGRKFLPELPEEEMLAIIDHCCRQQNEHLAQVGATLYPKLEENLEILSKDYPLFIVSNCERGYIECFFTAHGLQRYFKDWECPGNTGLPKADNIRMIVERNCLKSPLYVGDTQGDCNSATKAGVPFLFAAYGFGQVEGTYPSAETFEEIPSIINEGF